jgi:hypothetical protein
MDPFYSPDSINSYFIDQIKNYAIFAMDPQGIINTWNIGAERLKGYTEEEIIGQFYGILHPDDYQKAGIPKEEMESALRDGAYETEDWRKRKDGSLFWATVILTPIFSDDGAHIGFTKITGDITRQKELQDKLAERQQDALERKNVELKKINLDLDNFIYTASHDLRSPIINIEGMMSLLKEELKEINCLNEETEDLLLRVIASIDRFKQTINDLTEISRVQKDISENPSDEILNIKDIYEDIMADLNYMHHSKPCSVQTDFQVYQLKFSRKHLRSILYNLLSNAIKFQAPERPCIISLQTRLEGSYFILKVKDNGLGMNERQRLQLFTMLKRFHNHVEGTGIGLYIVKRIVDSAGGKIEVESEEGSGTEYKIYFNANM